MKVRDLLKETEEKLQPISNDEKDKLRNVLSSMYDTIQRFEKNGKINSKDDMEKIQMLRDTIQSMIQSKDREKVIKGDG
jgi:hypothetical protein